MNFKVEGVGGLGKPEVNRHLRRKLMRHFLSYLFRKNLCIKIK